MQINKFKLGLLIFLPFFLASTVGSTKNNSVENKKVRIALVQMKVEGGDLKGNLERAAARIARAAEGGAQIALLPEMMDLGWTHPSAKQNAFPVPKGKTCVFLARQAKKHRIYVCAGMAENDHGTIYNSAVLINPDGKLILKHRKLNELDIAHDLYAQGDRLNVAHTPLGTIGIHICADGFAYGNVISKSLGYMGADLILSPSSWAVPKDFNNDSTPYGDIWIKTYTEVSSLFNEFPF